jgi:hypothetical protein
MVPDDPLTSNAVWGVAVLIPTLLLVVSTSKIDVLIANALRAEVSVSAAVPEVEVRDKAPVVMVKPLLAVRVEENLPVPVTSKVVPGVKFLIPMLPEGLRTMFPVVVLSPKVSVCSAVVARVPVAERYTPPATPADTEAVGVPLLTFRTATWQSWWLKN